MRERGSNNPHDVAILKMENEIAQLEKEMRVKARRIVTLYKHIIKIESEKTEIKGWLVAADGV